MSTTSRIRASHCDIATPMFDPQKSIVFRQEKIIEDDQGRFLGMTPDQPPDITIPFMSVAATTLTVADPVTKQTVTVSAAGIAAWISAFYVSQQGK